MASCGVGVTLRELNSFKDMEIMEALDELLWGIQKTPAQQCWATYQDGGLFLGVFFEETMAGFAMALPKNYGGQTVLYARRMGVHPHFRRRGLAYQMKVMQKQLARAKGFERITWTYDPLESVNGYLNLHRLGGKAVAYLPNHYGDMGDELNYGLATDRFLVEWSVSEDEIRFGDGIATKDDYCVAFEVSINSNGLPVPGEVLSGGALTRQNPVLVPIPPNIQELKKQDLPLAVRWREQTGACFGQLFEAGYQAVDVFREPQAAYYVMEKQA